VGHSYRVAFRWQRHPGGRPTRRLRELATAALRALGVGPAEVGVLVGDDTTIRMLNRHFRGKDAPTDVLSFPAGFAQPDGLPYLGDVAISLETASRQASEMGVPLERELCTLLLHALVHLCGYDHESDAGEMEALEARLREELLP
jgi:probable rRNA maturation factor